MIKRTILGAALAATLAAGTLVPGTSANAAATTVTVRLWDSSVASAYQESFAQFYKKTGIRVRTVVIPWASYWTQLHADLATKSAGDIFWVNAGNFKNYARAGLLKPITKRDFGAEWSNWDPSVVRQYTDKNNLWGVPQLSDPGIGLYYNQSLLDHAGITVQQLSRLKWDPQAATDSLRSTALKLTRDSQDRSADSSAFDSAKISSYGFNAAFDLNAIVLNFLGSNGAAWQQGDTFSFDSVKGRQTIQYLVDLINVSKVSPPAVETNPPAGGDLSRDLFIQGKLALFESGSYNLANVLTGAKFKWGIARIPAGPSGAISVTNGIVAAASKYSQNPVATQKVLQWLGGSGAKYIGAKGAALTAVKSARAPFFSFWKAQNIDISPMIQVLDNGYVQAPSGANYASAETAYLPYFESMFAGQLSVPSGLAQAQQAANTAMKGTN